MTSTILDYRMSKPWYASKTIWFNALTILCAIAAFFGWTPDQQLTASVAGILVMASPFVNLALRFLTKKPIGSSAPASAEPLA